MFLIKLKDLSLRDSVALGFNPLNQVYVFNLTDTADYLDGLINSVLIP